MNGEPSAAIVLAGGKSTRLGRDKASEPLLGRPLLQRVIDSVQVATREITVVRAAGQRLPEVEAHVPIEVVQDVVPGKGPLGGIYTGLRQIDGEFAFVTGCDMPMLQPALISALLGLASGRRAVVPVVEGLPQPLCAVYARECLEPMSRRLDAGELKLALLLEEVGALHLQEEQWRVFDPRGLSFVNVNSDADLERVRQLILANET